MASTSTLPIAQPLQIGAAQIHLQNVQLREDVTLDEVHLEGESLRLELPTAGEPPRVTTGETRFRVVMSEANLNRTLAANLPPEAEIRNVRIVTLSGKVRFTGQRVVLGMGMPFTVEAVPRIENGVRAFPDLQALKVSVMSLPAALVEIIEQWLHKMLTLDLTKAPLPVWLDEIRCEPGRLTVLGKVRFNWPPTPLAPPVPPFSARESSPALEPASEEPAAVAGMPSTPSLPPE